MPPAKVKPSDVAAEAKKTYIPYIESKFATKWPAHSWLIPESARIIPGPPEERKRCRMSKCEKNLLTGFVSYKNLAVLEGDPVDVALELGITIDKPDGVVLVNMANDKRPGGDWEAGMDLPLVLSWSIRVLTQKRGSCTRRVSLQTNQSCCHSKETSCS
jgi:hypothetical protein